ncbi:unnamed protein product [Symbiodinium sp. CCMP2592]|nr:unnamed protein product [Symbiodinium sp. CCMP2592]
MAWMQTLTFVWTCACSTIRTVSEEACHVEGDTCHEVEQLAVNMLQAHIVARGSSSSQAQPNYHWASGRGNFPDYAVSQNVAPFNLNRSLAWSWHHPEGRFATLTYGTAIDEDGNIYLSAADGMRKFGTNGLLLWEYISLPAEVMNAPALYQGRVYGSSTMGHVFCLDMQTGQEVWKTRVSEAIGQDNGFNMVHDGVAIAACDWRLPSSYGPANQKVKGLNASTGEEMWTFQPDTPVWNFLPLFVEGGAFMFQDMTGKVYNVLLDTGHLVWKAGGREGTWTDGGIALGPNGLVYAVNKNHPVPMAPSNPYSVEPMVLVSEYSPGTLSAYNTSDGHLMWKVTTPRPPNNVPAVGKVLNLPGVSVVMPLCQQVHIGASCDVQVHDAETGGLRWTFHGPAQAGLYQAADAEGFATRLAHGVRGMCLPNGWSAPTIDAAGTVFVGNEEGKFFALRDLDGDGAVSGQDEVAFYHTHAAFAGSSSPAVAPGTVAVASCDTLFVFK